MISLIFIFWCLCRSSSWWLWPHIGVCKLLWPLLRAWMGDSGLVFCEMYVLYFQIQVTEKYSTAMCYQCDISEKWQVCQSTSTGVVIQNTPELLQCNIAEEEGYFHYCAHLSTQARRVISHQMIHWEKRKKSNWRDRSQILKSITMSWLISVGFKRKLSHFFRFFHLLCCA